jgi:hypothetical protein
MIQQRCNDPANMKTECKGYASKSIKESRDDYYRKCIDNCRKADRVTLICTPLHQGVKQICRLMVKANISLCNDFCALRTSDMIISE